MKRWIAALLGCIFAIACGFVDGAVPSPTHLSPTSTAAEPPSPSPSPLPIATSTPEPTQATQGGDPEVEVRGSDEFTAQTYAALDLLQKCAPEALATADIFLDAIQESDRSGMEVESGTFLASLSTAFAPNYSAPAQVFWYAGSIIHDARHNWQSKNGMTTNWSILTLEEREAIEADARGVQIAALELCVDFVDPGAREEVEWMLKYLVDMQNGVIPCDYCQVEWADRDW